MTAGTEARPAGVFLPRRLASPAAISRNHADRGAPLDPQAHPAPESAGSGSSLSQVRDEPGTASAPSQS